jgi:hypothetical protein
MYRLLRSQRTGAVACQTTGLRRESERATALADLQAYSKDWC